MPGGFPKIEIEIATYEDEWEFSFDGSYTSTGGDTVIVLTSPMGKEIVEASKLHLDVPIMK